MSKAISFTKAQVRRAVKGAESAGLKVRRVTINTDGSITVDGENGPAPVDNQEKELAASWSDA